MPVKERPWAGYREEAGNRKENMKNSIVGKREIQYERGTA